MEKYKICPACGAHNNPLFLECEACEADLQNVPVTDDHVAQRDVNVVQPPMVRICDGCGAKNPPQARRCQACGEDISTVFPTPDEAQPEVKYVLSSLDGAYAYEVAPGETVVGREHEMADYLASKHYVSRRHAELRLNDGTLTLENCSQTNYTFVNNRRIAEVTALQDGDEIGLGGNEQDGQRQSEAAYFIVRIGACT